MDTQDLSLGDQAQDKDERNAQAVKHWGPKWLLNAARNHADYYSDRGSTVGTYFGTCYRRPIAICGLGPSLNDSLDQMQGRGDDAGLLFMASTSAAKILEGYGRPADFLALFHCDASVMGHFDGLPKRPRILFSTTSAQPEAIAAFRECSPGGTVIWHTMSHNGFPQVEALRHMTPGITAIPNFGCVSNAMVILATLLGCNPLYLLGFDFAYTKDRYGATVPGVEPVSGEEEIRRKQCGKNPEEFFKRVDGVLTDHVMLGYRNSLDHVFKGLTNLQGIPVGELAVNCSQGGLKLDAPEMSFGAALELEARRSGSCGY